MTAIIIDSFEEISLAALLSAPAVLLDALPYGVIGLDRLGYVQLYNATEASMAGLDRANVIGLPFFSVVAQCMNNFMVAQRFDDEPALDDIIPFVLTLRMKPTRVRLRLLATTDAAIRFILVER